MRTMDNLICVQSRLTIGNRLTSAACLPMLVTFILNGIEGTTLAQMGDSAAVGTLRAMLGIH